MTPYDENDIGQNGENGLFSSKYHAITWINVDQCDVIRNRLWRLQQNENWASEARERCVKVLVFYRHLWIRYVM